MRISCIIPAYNEAERIWNVIEAALASKYIDEIIVINDWSTDNTSEVVSRYKNIVFLDFEKNSWKANAVITWFKKATWDYFIMLDSDLLWLDAKIIDELILPVINKEADITLSLRKNSYMIYKFFGSDIFSWERVFSRDLLNEEDYKKLLELPWFCLESYINNIIITKQKRIKSVYIPSLISPRKKVKYWYFKWTFMDMKMVIEIAKVFWVIWIIKQSYNLWKLLTNKKDGRTYIFR